MTGLRKKASVLVVLLMMVGGLLATGGVASASASVTITGGHLLQNGNLRLDGTVECATSTGTADLWVHGRQFYPLAYGAQIIGVDCTAGLVPWAVDLYPAPGPYRAPGVVTVGARLTRPGVFSEASYLGTIYV